MAIPKIDDQDINTMPRCDIEALKSEIKLLKELLKECRDMINNHCSWQVMDRPNHYVKKIENDIYEPLLTKIDNAIGERDE